MECIVIIMAQTFNQLSKNSREEIAKKTVICELKGGQQYLKFKEDD